MNPDTPIGDPAKVQPLSNDGTPPATPVVNADAAEVERLKKEADQAKMRAAQTQNELDRMKAAQAELDKKALEDKEEFKLLYEQTQSKLKEIEDAQAASDRQTAVTTATAEVFKDYPANVVELAQTAGLKLTDDSDEARTALKKTLDAFKEKVGSGPAPTARSNNPGNPAPVNIDRQALVTKTDGVSPMALAAAKGDITPQLQYISELSAIKRMKELSQGA